MAQKIDKKEEKKQEKSILIIVMLFVAAICLLVAATYFRSKGSFFFYDVESGKYSATFLTEDLPDDVPVLWKSFQLYFKDYFNFYFFPAFVLLLPAIIAASAAFNLLTLKKLVFFYFLKNKKYEKIFVMIICLFTLASVTVVHIFIIHMFAPITDEFSYLFQADLLSSGKLYAQSPPYPDSFSTLNIINDGRWYSKYTIGWPLLLAIGWLFGIEYLINPICAAFSVLLLYLLGKNLFDERAGLILSLIHI